MKERCVAKLQEAVPANMKRVSSTDVFPMLGSIMTFNIKHNEVSAMTFNIKHNEVSASF